MKNTNEHTPGSWSMEGDELIAHGDVIGMLDLYGNAEADARLIAAAPDLLAALEELVVKVRTAGWHRSEVAEAQEAIAKATRAESERSNGYKLSDDYCRGQTGTTRRTWRQ